MSLDSHDASMPHFPYSSKSDQQTPLFLEILFELMSNVERSAGSEKQFRENTLERWDSTNTVIL